MGGKSLLANRKALTNVAFFIITVLAAFGVFFLGQIYPVVDKYVHGHFNSSIPIHPTNQSVNASNATNASDTPEFSRFTTNQTNVTAGDWKKDLWDQTKGIFPKIVIFLKKYMGEWWWAGFMILAAIVLFFFLFLVAWFAELLDIGAKALVLIALAIFMFILIFFLLQNWGIIQMPVEEILNQTLNQTSNITTTT